MKLPLAIILTHNHIFIMQLNKQTKTIIAVGLPLIIALIFLFRDYIIPIGHYFPCIFHKVTGLLCPGCGNTRAVNHLVHGQIWLALRSNPDLPFIIIVPAGFYAELIADLLGKKLIIIPRSLWFWTPIFALFALFYVLRNIFPILAPP